MCMPRLSALVTRCKTLYCAVVHVHAYDCVVTLAWRVIDDSLTHRGTAHNRIMQFNIHNCRVRVKVLQAPNLLQLDISVVQGSCFATAFRLSLHTYMHDCLSYASRVNPCWTIHKHSHTNMYGLLLTMHAQTYTNVYISVPKCSVFRAIASSAAHLHNNIIGCKSGECHWGRVQNFDVYAVVLGLETEGGVSEGYNNV